MNTMQIVFLAIAAGLVLTAAWNIIQSRRIDQMRRRLDALEKKAS